MIKEKWDKINKDIKETEISSIVMNIKMTVTVLPFYTAQYHA